MTTQPYLKLCCTASLLLNWLLFFILITVGWPTLSLAQPGALDHSFGSAGQVITALGNFGDRCNAVLIQHDQKILLGGSTQSSFTSSDFALMRFHYDGTLDTNFGTNGKVITSIENRSKAQALAIQEDGKILAGGNSQWYMNLARYNDDGTLDLNFGSDGTLIIDIEGYYSEQCQSIALQEDGKILLGGYGQHFSNDGSYFILVRCNTDGSLDTTFGNGGVVIGGVGQGNTMTIQSDGKILLGGSSNGSFAVVRYHADGTIDNTFGTDGIVNTPVGSSSEGKSLALQSNGKIVIGGSSYNLETSHDFTITRYNMDGTLDNTFGIDGIVTTPVEDSQEANSLVIQGDGKIILGGYGNNDASVSTFAIMRYNTDGALDDTFGDGEVVTSPIGDFHSTGLALGIHTDGKMVLGGYVYNGSNQDIAVLRYNGDADVGTGEACCRPTISSISPNPFHSLTTIQLDKPVYQAVLNIFDASGQLVQKLENISGQEILLSRNNLPNGLYFLQLLEKNQIVAAGKLVIIG